MPAVLTCIVGKQLCRNPATDDHWSLRDSAATLMAAICRYSLKPQLCAGALTCLPTHAWTPSRCIFYGYRRKYGDAYSTLQPRVVKTLLRAFLDPLKPLGTHYGAIQGLAALGPVVIQSFVLPNVEAYMKLLEPHLQPDSTNPVKALEARRCHSALLVRPPYPQRRQWEQIATTEGVPSTGGAGLQMATALFYRARKAATVDARLVRLATVLHSAGDKLTSGVTLATANRVTGAAGAGAGRDAVQHLWRCPGAPRRRTSCRGCRRNHSVTLVSNRRSLVLAIHCAAVQGPALSIPGAYASTRRPNRRRPGGCRRPDPGARPWERSPSTAPPA